MKAEVLVTGFTWFNGFQHNPAEEVAEALNGRIIEGYRVRALILPVSLRAVRSMLRRALEELRPRLALGLGLDPSAREVRLELVAYNIACFREPDVDGHRAWLEPVDPEGPRAAATTLPVERIARRCEEKGLKLKPSVSLGTYVCNAAAYTIMSYAEKHGAMGGFLHVPPCTELALRSKLENSMPLHEQIEIVETVIEESLKAMRECSSSKRY